MILYRDRALKEAIESSIDTEESPRLSGRAAVQIYTSKHNFVPRPRPSRMDKLKIPKQQTEDSRAVDSVQSGIKVKRLAATYAKVGQTTIQSPRDLNVQDWDIHQISKFRSQHRRHQPMLS